MAIYYKTIKLMLLNAATLFIFLGSISSICFGKDSFEQIEIDLRKKQAEAHELIADVVSAIVCPSVAFLYCNQDMLHKLYILNNPNGPYPTLSELKKWAKRIIACYESIYGKISIYNKLSFSIQIPAIRNLLFCALCMPIACYAGFLLSEYF